MRKTCYFIRHGESHSNAGGITMAHKAIPLTERGHRQANFIAEQLNISPTLVMMSEHIRSQQTAKPFCDKHQCNTHIEPWLNEFSAISHELILGMNVAERRPIADAYWNGADINQRMGDLADTFVEFNHRVSRIKSMMNSFENNTVIFGHGIWFGLLVWQLFGFEVFDSISMKAFRRFQTGLPLANGIVYQLTSNVAGNWSIQVDRKIMQSLLLTGQ
jgi:alpha-ribazole phosphatase